ALAFRHQTYYDHALARLFARGKRSLADHVLEGQDGLFVRPAMLNGLEFLRTTAPDVYREQVRRIWGAAPRAHVRTLLLEFLASRSDPDAFEAGIVVPLLGTEQGPALLRAAAGSRGWFERLRDSAELAAWMRQPHDRAALCVGFLAGALVTDLECVRRLLVRHWVADPAYDALVVGVAQYVPKWDTAWVELVCASVRRSPVQIIWTANAVADSDPVLAPRLVRAQLDRELGQAEGQHAARVKATSSPDGDAPEETHFGSMRDEFTALLDGRNGDRYTLPEIAKNCPEPFLREVWPWLIAVLRRCPERHKHGTTYTDDRATWISADIRPIPLLEAIGAAASGWAEAAPDAFVAFALREADATEFLAAHRVLVRGFLVLPATHAAHALSYLLADPRRLAIGTFRNQYESTSALIAALASRLSAEQRRKLEDAVLHFEMYPVTDDARDAEYRRDLTRYNRQARLRLLRAFPAEHLSRETAAFRAQEENLLPGTRSFDSESCGGFVGPRMTADELAKASDADVLNVIEVVAERDAKGRESLWRFGVGRSGGTREEAGAFGALAEREPERVIGLLSKLRPPRDDPYAAAAIMGLAKSPLASDQLFRLVVDVHSRGFTSDDVRDRVADAVEHRASRRDPVPAGIVAMLETWLDEMAIPCPTAVIDDADDGAAAAKAPDGPIVFGHGGSLGILMHGRGAVARALGAAHGRRDPVNAAEMVRLLHTRAERERHPHVLAEMLTYFIPCFREPVAATAAYDAVIAACPAVLGLRLGIHALAELTGSADPTVRYEGWLDQMRAIQSPFVRQAYGELLFLYRARTSATGADARIAPLLAGDDVDALRGLAYGAAEAWSEAHCRAVATDILCAAARVPDEGIRRAITIAFIPPEERFTLDPDAKRVVAAVIEHQELLRHVGGQVLDALTPAAGIEPEVVAMACRAVLDLFASGSASGQMSTEVAGPLTSAALTLHRQPEYRAEGLRLFEELIRLGVHDAAAALALIDRRASANVGPTLLPRLRRRRR
ncbi:MAG TPA: hypothetical protein VK986_23945, partial [Tepidisphaeraceae bacterium]|nr:hypothetical protein [Tepidisphaeraceae bacterium]